MNAIRRLLCGALIVSSGVVSGQTLHAQEDGTTAKPAPDGKNAGVRVFLMDGSVVTGELGIEQIEVQTEFGKLTIPVDKILSITPGLKSQAKLAAQLNKLIEDLGSKEEKTRNDAQRELLRMGTGVRKVLAAHSNDPDAERKRQVNEILEKLSELSDDDLDDEVESNQHEYTEEDVVVTKNFTIAGSVSPSVFKVASKYGPLNISLSDVKRAQREATAKEAVVKRLSVSGTKLVQRGMQSSGIRVEPGDTIIISASGQIVMTPWGSNAVTGPEGSPNYGQYVSNTGGRAGTFFGGALLAKIGNGPLEKVGEKAKFTAKKAGLLQFGIACQDAYANENYQFPGTYSVRIKVEPKAE